MKQILFVCLGNICRSPTAEAIMKLKVKNAGLENQIQCDSAATGNHFAGHPADSNMRRHAAMRNINITSVSRPVDTNHDFTRFDYIIAMDDHNYSDLQSLNPDSIYASKIKKMTDFCSQIKCQEVPDPYQGGEAGFKYVLDILDDACNGLLEYIKKDL